VSALKFLLKAKLSQRVDCSALTLVGLSGKTGAEIQRIALPIGNSTVPVGDIFKVSGGDCEQIIFAGETNKLDRIGAQMSSGDIVIDGDGGDYLGQGMKGGSLRIAGSAGIFAACEMRGGELNIHGDCGDFLGGALPGNRRGMFGGAVIVRGNLAARGGDQMRRGMILVAGNVGDYLGSRMSGGTIVAMGEVGAFAGYAMKRGSLLLKHRPKEMMPTFSDCGVHPFGFLSLLLPVIRRHGKSFDALKFSSNHAQRYMGDVANIGRGEILLPV
jgi:formylmethanofuran dehydrogenase subunit C